MRNVALKKEARELKLGPKIREKQSTTLAVQDSPTEAGLASEVITLKTNSGAGKESEHLCVQR